MHRLILRTGILLLMAAIGVTLRAATPGEVQTLKGIQGVAVLIEPLTSEVEAAGLHETDIQTDVELKLRLAGIKVLTMAQAVNPPFVPYLYVNEDVELSQQQRLAYFAIKCDLVQGVRLTRDASITTSAATWDVFAAGITGQANLRGIRDGVKELVDRFINAYLSVNPKK